MPKRERAQSHCPICKKVPKENENGNITCSCGTRWVRRRGVRGTPEEEARFERVGFQWTVDIRGDGYYVLPEGHIVHLYPDGTWDSDKAALGASLEEYLDWIEEKLALIAGAGR